MKSTAILLALVSAGTVMAQPPADCKPSALNIPGAPYPCLMPDHRAMFRIAAPNAQKVEVHAGGNVEMTKKR